MNLKNTFFKWLDKLENVKISPVWGYSFAVCLFLFAGFLVVAQIDVVWGGGEFIPLWFQLGYALVLLAVALVLLTKKTKKYGAKIARFSAMAFWFISGYIVRFIPSNPQMHGDCYFDPVDYVKDAIVIVALFVGYAVGKYIAKRIKDSNMATVKEELSQG